ncbi:hypothetical protein Tco_0548883 [Tanacetum coccineum]
MVTPEYKKVERYIWGLTKYIQGKVASLKPSKIQEAICMAHDLMDQVVRAKIAKDSDNKRNWEDKQGINPYWQQNKRREVVRVYDVRLSDRKGYARTLPLYDKCKHHHHHGPCPVRELQEGRSPNKRMMDPYLVDMLRMWRK